MSKKIDTLTQKIHELLLQVKAKYGLEFKVDLLQYEEGCQAFSDICGQKENGKFICVYCQRWGGQDREVPVALNKMPPQIRQILVGLQGVLGINPDFNHTTDFYYYSNSEDVYELGFQEGQVKLKLAQALCQRWLDGLEPLFDREPETVLQELVKILEDLLK